MPVHRNKLTACRAVLAAAAAARASVGPPGKNCTVTRACQRVPGMGTDSLASCFSHSTRVASGSSAAAARTSTAPSRPAAVKPEAPRGDTVAARDSPQVISNSALATLLSQSKLLNNHSGLSVCSSFQRGAPSVCCRMHKDVDVHLTQGCRFWPGACICNHGCLA